MVKRIFAFGLFGGFLVPTVNAGESNIYYFVKSEQNEQDRISGLGIEWLNVDRYNRFGISANSVLSVAQVIDEQGYQQEYFAWEYGLKWGYFSDYWLYGEAGVDVFELIFKDHDNDDGNYSRNEQHHDDSYHYHSHDSLDLYLGLGFGIELKPFVVETSMRLRNIDAPSWQAKNLMFANVQLGFKF